MNTAPKLSELLQKVVNTVNAPMFSNRANEDAAWEAVSFLQDHGKELLSALAPPSGEGVVVPRKLLEAVIARDGGNACNCIYHSRKAEREYENSHCPHQQLAALLTKSEAK